MPPYLAAQEEPTFLRNARKCIGYALKRGCCSESVLPLTYTLNLTGHPIDPQANRLVALVSRP